MLSPTVITSSVIEELLKVLTSPEKMKAQVEELQRLAREAEKVRDQAVAAGNAAQAERTNLDLLTKEAALVVEEARTAKAENTRVKQETRKLLEKVELDIAARRKQSDDEMQLKRAGWDEEVKAQQEVIRSLHTQTAEAQAQLVRAQEALEAARRDVKAVHERLRGV